VLLPHGDSQDRPPQPCSLLQESAAAAPMVSLG